VIGREGYTDVIVNILIRSERRENYQEFKITNYLCEMCSSEEEQEEQEQEQD